MIGYELCVMDPQVFPNAILWIDPPSNTGILLGSADDAAVLGLEWPGYARSGIHRDPTEKQVRESVLLDSQKLQDYSAAGTIITDDNQLLAYGKAPRLVQNTNVRGKHEILKSIKPYKSN